MKKKIFTILLCGALILGMTGCDKNNAEDKSDIKSDNAISKNLQKQETLDEPEELTISEDGLLEIEVNSMAEPDKTKPEEKSIFLTIITNDKTDFALQYTYDTNGVEGAILCGDVKKKKQLQPFYAMRLTQSSQKNYKEIWLSGGSFLENGENVFYLNGGDQTFPYRMILKFNFFEPEKIEKVISHPSTK